MLREEKGLPKNYVKKMLLREGGGSEQIKGNSEKKPDEEVKYGSVKKSLKETWLGDWVIPIH